MKIALVGYGKMGKAIEQIALSRGHDIVLRISGSNRATMTAEALQQADVAIEFSTPEVAYANVMDCLTAGVNTVCGTTGWPQNLLDATHFAQNNPVGFLHATNFSIGVNIFFEVNTLLARLMNGRQEYDVTIDETHHIHKMDKPGGTAISVAEQIVANIGHKSEWQLTDNATELPMQVLPILAHRVGEVPGTHVVRYSSDVDDIEISHTAHNRSGFALGAVLAAEFLVGRHGVYTMRHVLGLGNAY